MKHQNGFLPMPGISVFANWQRAALTTVFIAASAAQAYAVPLPRPAPKARDMQVAASEPAPPAPPAAVNTAPRQPISEPVPNPILPTLKKLFGGDSPASKVQTFDATQRALADKVSAYLSSLQNLSGNFVQVGPDGSRTTGNFYLLKPGKIRFEYDDPSPIALVADGTSVIVRDRRLATQDVYPLSQTPLRYLLASKLDLLRDTNVTSISADDLYVSITIEEKQAVTGTSRLTLMTGAKDGKLKQWTVTDPQGYDTTVAVYNLDTARKLDPALFKIDYTNYQGGNN